ncbi:hypothetical protein FKM82_012311 [Ascaphus truei]
MLKCSVQSQQHATSQQVLISSLKGPVIATHHSLVFLNINQDEWVKLSFHVLNFCCSYIFINDFAILEPFLPERYNTVQGSCILNLQLHNSVFYFATHISGLTSSSLSFLTLIWRES